MKRQRTETADNLKSLIDADPSLDFSVKDARASATMLGSGETFLSAFAVFLNASAMQIGILSSLPQLVGSLGQLLSVWLSDRITNRRAIITSGAILQAITWIVIAILAIYTGGNRISILILLAGSYYFFAGIISPIWNSFIGDIVPSEIRGRYFAKRNKSASIATLIAMIIIGQQLHFFEERKLESYGFFIVFIIAGLARLVSAYFLSKHRNPAYQVKPEDKFTIYQFIVRLPYSNFAKYVLYFALLNFSVWIVAPFFGVYMLRDLGVNYEIFTLLTITPIIAQILTFRYWGRISDLKGNKSILDFCGLFIVAFPLLWMFSENIYFLILIQLLSGFIWGGYNFAAANFIFDAVTPPKRTRAVAYQSLINTTFVVLGSLFGGFLAVNISNPEFASSIFPVPASKYHFVMFISCILRLLCITTLRYIYKEVKEVKAVPNRSIIFSIDHIRDLGGFLVRPLGLTRKSKEKDEDL